MKIIVVSDAIPARQWIGRLFNESGVLSEHSRFCDVVYVNSPPECLNVAEEDENSHFLTVLWMEQFRPEMLECFPDEMPVVVILDQPLLKNISPQSESGSRFEFVDVSRLNAPVLLGSLERLAVSLAESS